MGEAELQRAIAGDVLVPGADGYESVRRPPIGRFDDVRPQAIVRCTTPAMSPRRSPSRAAPELTWQTCLLVIAFFLMSFP